MKKLWIVLALLCMPWLARAEDSAVMSGFGKTTAHGLVQARFGYNKDATPTNWFTLGNVQLSWDGAFEDKVKWGVMVTPTVGGTALQDAWGTLLCPKNMANITMGQWKTPFNYEGAMTGDGASVMIGKAWLSGATAPRDLGVAVWGTPVEMMSYTLGVFNGTGVAVEDNKSKDVVANVNLKPMAGVNVFGGLRYSDNSNTAFTGGAKFEMNGALAQLEYVGGKWNNGNKVDGMYGLVGYWIMPDKLQIAGRYQWWNDDKDNTADKKDVGFGGGLNYWVMTNTKASLNFENTKKDGATAENAITFQLQVQI